MDQTKEEIEAEDTEFDEVDGKMRQMLGLSHPKQGRVSQHQAGGDTLSPNYFTCNERQPYRGFLFIFNMTKFRYLAPRDGSDKDNESLIRVFRALKYEIHGGTNLTRQQVIEEIETTLRESHKLANHDSVVCIFLTHGEAGGILHAYDGAFSLEKDIFPLFKADNCPKLNGKPKLFFIQACRGEKTMEHRKQIGEDRFEFDALDTRDNISIPMEADFLKSYSTCEGFFSFRNNTKGSWYVQILYRVLFNLMQRPTIENEDGTVIGVGEPALKRYDINAIMTTVNHCVAGEFRSNCNDPAFFNKSQVPSFCSTLRKFFYF